MELTINHVIRKLVLVIHAILPDISACVVVRPHFGKWVSIQLYDFFLCPCPGCFWSWALLIKYINFIFRSESKKAAESETNTIDRAIANLMFNKTDSSVRELSSAASVSSNEGVTGDTQPPVNSEQEGIRATGPQNYSSNQPKIHHFSHHPILSGDAEVPTLAQIDSRATSLHKKNADKINENYRNSAEKRKSFVLEFGSIIWYAWKAIWRLSWRQGSMKAFSNQATMKQSSELSFTICLYIPLLVMLYASS